MRTMARFSLYGQKGAGAKASGRGSVIFDPTIPGRDRAIDALCRRITRETGCSAQARLDCWAADGSSDTFEITLTKPTRWPSTRSVEGGLWATLFRGIKS